MIVVKIKVANTEELGFINGSSEIKLLTRSHEPAYTWHSFLYILDHFLILTCPHCFEETLIKKAFFFKN